MRVLVCGASYTGKILHHEFPSVEVRFLTRRPEALVSQALLPFDPALSYVSILDTIPAVEENGRIDLPYRSEIELVLGKSSSAQRCRLVHISSTSVYAEDFHGEEKTLPCFDEFTPARPETVRGERRLALEERIKESFPDAVILRAGGIYGPGRALPLQFLAGQFGRADSGNRMVSRIHVHDLAQLALAAATSDIDLINAVDGNSALNSEVFAYLENLLSVKVPGSWATDLPSGRRIISRYADQLIRFRYPDYRSGFEEILRDADKLPLRES